MNLLLPHLGILYKEMVFLSLNSSYPYLQLFLASVKTGPRTKSSVVKKKVIFKQSPIENTYTHNKKFYILQQDTKTRGALINRPWWPWPDWPAASTRGPGALTYNRGVLGYGCCCWSRLISQLSCRPPPSLWKYPMNWTLSFCVPCTMSQ